MIAILYIRKQITLALLGAAHCLATTSAARYYIRNAKEYEDAL